MQALSVSEMGTQKRCLQVVGTPHLPGAPAASTAITEIAYCAPLLRSEHCKPTDYKLVDITFMSVLAGGSISFFTFDSNKLIRGL
jgi:hypothetical protein